MRMSEKTRKNPKIEKVSPFDDPNLNLWVLLDQTRDVISKARELELAHYKLSRVQAATLFMLLVVNKELTISEISNWNVREPNSVLSLINRMEKIGLVEKIRDSGDDKMKIVITETGREAYM